MRSESIDRIVVDDLYVTYPSRKEPSVKDVSFSIEKGEFIWLAGNSASGKSTLINCLCGFIPHIIPAEVKGTISLNNRCDLDPLDLARHICMVHQDPESQFCTEYVEDEIAFGLENRCIPQEEIDERVEEVLGRLNCSHLRYRSLQNLSGGEKQKVAIASMLVLEPEVLILDEPTSNLDARSMDEVIDAVENVRRKSRGLTLVIAEHRMGDLIDEVDRVIRMDDGMVCEDLRAENMTPKRRVELVERPYPSHCRDRVNSPEVMKIKGLSWAMEGKHILKDIDAGIRRGDIVALLGSNGSGKTSLIKHILGLVELQEGSIEINGVVKDRVKKVPVWKLGEQIGLVFQNPNHQIFENTVKDEMMFAPENFSKGLKGAEKGLHRLIEYEGIMEDTHPHNLSFGQKRRLNIESSTSHDPGIVILDEPFSGQDHQNALRIVDLLNRLWLRGKTLLIVTHDMEFARKFCTRFWIIKKGELVYDGPPLDMRDDRLIKWIG